MAKEIKEPAPRIVYSKIFFVDGACNVGGACNAEPFWLAEFSVFESVFQPSFLKSCSLTSTWRTEAICKHMAESGAENVSHCETVPEDA